MKKKKTKNKKRNVQKKEKQLTFLELLAEKKQIIFSLNENEKKCYKKLIEDIQIKLESCSNEKQIKAVETEISNESYSFIRAFETLKRICIHGTVKNNNIIIPIEVDILQSLEDIWNEYGDKIVYHY